jgi:deoxyinosine 3'endonuclease (endonuclease V)
MLCYREQELLKRRLVLTDDFSWKPITTSSNDEDSVAVNSSGISDQSKLRYVGGVDLSFSKLDESIACAALVVMDLEIMQVVYEDFDTVKLTMPYIAGFLAFREVLSLSLSLHCRSHFLMQFVLYLFFGNHSLNAICSFSLSSLHITFWMQLVLCLFLKITV